MPNLTSVLIASYKRPEALNRTLQALKDSVGANPVEVIVAVEDNDSAHVVRTWDYNTWNDDTFYVRGVYNRDRLGPIAAWNEALHHSTGYYLFPMGDDQLPHVGWLDEAIKAHERKLDAYGCLGLNDLHHPYSDNMLMTTLFYDRFFCKSYFGGVAAIPAYKYYFVDNELNARARKNRRLEWCAESIVEHLHPSVGKRPADTLDAERAGYWHDDEAQFHHRQAQGFPDDFAAVIW